MDIKTLAGQLNISEKQLRTKIAEAGFEVSERARKIDNSLAKQIEEALAEKQDDEVEENAEQQIIEVPEYISVKEFATKLDKPVTEVIKTLMQNGVMATINEEIDSDTAEIIGEEFGVSVVLNKLDSSAKVSGVGYVGEVLAKEDEQDLKLRPPIVTVMGHVDHGKTTLLDTIRKSNVAGGEAGAITQHIGAYQVEHSSSGSGQATQKITFLDTPGHEAFAAMRARGANVTDIIVLVVAADDGVKPQTVEVINRAKLTKTPLIVAINKMDKPGVNPDKVKGELAEQGVNVEDWGGNVPSVPVSAKTAQGIDDLLEVILLTAEVAELKANPKGKTVGTVIESHLSKGHGSVATVLIQNGTLKIGDVAVAGTGSGKIRNMVDGLGNKIKSAGPGTPVKLTGLSDVPEVGDVLQVVADLNTAKKISQEAQRQHRAKRLQSTRAIKADPNKRELNLIIRADVQGSLEAIIEQITKLENDSVKLKIVDQGVGEVTESDVSLAHDTGSIVIAFNAKVNPNAVKNARQNQVVINQYSIIYELIEDITQVLLEMMPVEVERVDLGRAKIKAVFRTEKASMIVGGEVIDGKIVDKKNFEIIRDKEIVGTGKVLELQTGKVEVDQVQSGKEFGTKIELAGEKVVEGDILNVYDEVVKKKTLNN